MKEKVNIQDILPRLNAYKNTYIIVNGKKVYIELFYSGFHLYSFKILASYFGEVIYEGKTSEDLENYLNTL